MPAPGTCPRDSSTSQGLLAGRALRALPTMEVEASVCRHEHLRLLGGVALQPHSLVIPPDGATASLEAPHLSLGYRPGIQCEREPIRVTRVLSSPGSASWWKVPGGPAANPRIQAVGRTPGLTSPPGCEGCGSNRFISPALLLLCRWTGS